MGYDYHEHCRDQALLPLIRDGGGVLNVSTGLTRFTTPGYSAYAAMKGAIATDFRGGAVRDNADVNAYLAAHTALGRVGLPDDIGAAMAALLSPGTRWVNAQRVEASGGMFV